MMRGLKPPALFMALLLVAGIFMGTARGAGNGQVGYYIPPGETGEETVSRLPGLNHSLVGTYADTP